jgi:hypothetical protein
MQGSTNIISLEADLPILVGNERVLKMPSAFFRLVFPVFDTMMDLNMIESVLYSNRQLGEVFEVALRAVRGAGVLGASRDLYV